MSLDEENERVGAAEIWVSHLLRAGVALSLVLILIGGVLSFWHHRAYFTSPESLRPLTAQDAQFPHDVRAVAASAFQGYGRGWVVAGLFVLICTPVLRVALTLVIFVAQRDKAYVVLSAIVLTLLAISFMLGRAGG